MKKVSVIRPLLKGKVLDPLINGTDHPGTYRWWFHEDSLKALGLSNNSTSVLLQKTIGGRKYYALYFGITVKESIRKRLDWHINQKHTISNMRSGGTLSTLRRSLGALLLGSINNPGLNQSEITINQFMDQYCIVEWMPYEKGDNNKEELKEEIETVETVELNKKYWYPLNLDKNKSGRRINLSYLHDLSAKRKLFSL